MKDPAHHRDKTQRKVLREARQEAESGLAVPYTPRESRMPASPFETPASAYGCGGLVTNGLHSGARDPRIMYSRFAGSAGFARPRYPGT